MLYSQNRNTTPHQKKQVGGGGWNECKDLERTHHDEEQLYSNWQTFTCLESSERNRTEWTTVVGKQIFNSNVWAYKI